MKQTDFETVIDYPILGGELPKIRSVLVRTT